MPLQHLAFGPWHVETWTLLGRAPLVLCVLLLLVGGHKRQWPWRANVLATAAFAAGLSLGAWLLPSVVGALAGGLLVWCAAQRILHLRQPPLLALAMGLTALIAIGRWGCLLAGCCFGRPTDLPWGVHYGTGSFALALHHALHLVTPDATQSLAVHPYPLYESLGLALWLVVLLRFGARLQSQAAALAATVAFDLALRAGIDGQRAMLNVWWAATGSWFGIDRLRGLFAVAALASLATAVVLERRARRAPQPLAQTSRAVPASAWALYLGLLSIAVVTRFGGTPLLHWTLLAALAAGALALPVPQVLASRAPQLARLAPFAALLLLLPLALPSAVHADDGDAAPTTEREWLYVPVPNAQALVRVGNAQDSPQVLAALEQQLTGDDFDHPPGPDDVTPTTAPDPANPPERRPSVWVGASGQLGQSDYQVRSTGCSGSSSVTNHRNTAYSGAGTVNVQVPVLEQSDIHVGLRVGVAHNVDSKSTSGTSTANGITSYGTSTDESRGTAMAATGWGEFASPYFGAGIGGMMGFSSVSGYMLIVPGGYLRAGHPLLSLEAGLNDRQAMSPFLSARVGLTSAGFLPNTKHPVHVRGFLGVESFPTATLSLGGPPSGVGVNLDVQPVDWLQVGAQLMIGESMFGGLAVRVNPVALAK